MKDLLEECCIIVLQILERLRNTGEITEEEYQEHTKLKIKFLEKAPK